ncbi:MT-A70 family methyltransferase [Paraburkholderia sp. A3BS-1L]|uniref:MT-A70 family methyltransferase n=1 Tax=Paraburkholderia sp. A3BS-1L TaxID=3028375 RepID=UPI003DA84915
MNSPETSERIAETGGKSHPRDKAANREAIRRAIEAEPQATNTAIAKLVGTSRDTVIAVRRQLGEASALAALDATRSALVTADNVADVKTIRDKAKGIQAWAREAQDTAMFEKATRLFMEAERRAGELLMTMVERGERDAGHGGDRKSRSRNGTVNKLSDLGITKKQSMKWQQLARMDADKFESHVTQTSKRVVSVASQAEETALRRAERIAYILDICTGNAPLDGIAQRYPVLYVDPPWRYEHVKTESRAIENQYPTMSLEEIKALPVAEIAFDDCVLFMWATSPKLAEAFEVLTAWGFTYRTCAVWDKQKIGMGYYFRQQHELLLVATRGDPIVPEPYARAPSVFSYPRAEHSAKPVECYAMIEAMYPELPRLEMFARLSRGGWDAWGNQSRGGHREP